MMGYPKKVVSEILAKMEKIREAHRIRVDGLKRDYWITDDDLNKVEKIKKEEHIALLNPLDPFLRQMSWVRSLFGYSFEKEYFRKKGMKWQLSILLDTEFVGFFDPKAERKQKTMQIKELALNRTLNDEEWTRLIEELVRFTKFHQFDTLRISHVNETIKAVLNDMGFDKKGRFSIPASPDNSP